MIKNKPLSRNEPAHKLFAAFHDHNLPKKRELCLELRDLIQKRIIRGSHSIRDAMEQHKDVIPKDIYQAMVQVTESDRRAATTQPQQRAEPEPRSEPQLRAGAAAARWDPQPEQHAGPSGPTGPNALETAADRDKRKLVYDLCQLFHKQADRMMDICMNPNADLQNINKELPKIDHFKMMLDFSTKL